MRHKNWYKTLYYPAPAIDRRKKIHKLLDEAMPNKRVIITNSYGCFSGPYISHSHRRKTGDTVLIYLCTESINGSGVYCPNKVTIMHCTDSELEQYIKIEQSDGTDQQKEEYFGTTNLNQIRSILRWNGYNL